jgi:hypothetical protein
MHLIFPQSLEIALARSTTRTGDDVAVFRLRRSIPKHQ